MGRVCDLVQALPESIKGHKCDPNVEFVLLSYNDKSGMADWVRMNLCAELASGRVVFAETTEPEYYRFGHSRNVAALLCSGDIICSLDADNIAPEGFSRHLRVLMQSLKFPLITCDKKIRRGSRVSSGECSGRKAYKKNQFVEILRGYDERFDGWGADDGDITMRAITAGFNEVHWEHSYYKLVPKSSQVLFTQDPKRMSSLATNRVYRDGNMAEGVVGANVGKPWGVAKVKINFKKMVDVGSP
jgi:hypothetical protein